ncbi:hypothetical protein C8F01DRAFT_1106369, partial [Mycena amicta]
TTTLFVRPAASHTVPKADIILRSCDEPPVDFYVHRAVLALSSPLFADLFSLPQPIPKDDSRDASRGKDEQELPVVQVSERAEILDKALRFFYPGTAPFSNSASSSIEAVVGKRLLGRHLESDAVGVFVVACGMRWEDVAREAAWRSLRQPIRQFVESNGDSASDSLVIFSFPHPTPSSPLLMHLPASTYHALLNDRVQQQHDPPVAAVPSVPGADCTDWNHPDVCPRDVRRTHAGAGDEDCLDWVGEKLKIARSHSCRPSRCGWITTRMARRERILRIC